MSSPFLGEIEIFGFNFAPYGWAQCNGQLLPVTQNTALFSLLGTQFGGDGHSTFGLPNLQGQIPVGPGQGPGLSRYTIGETAGAETVTLTVSEIPSHTHTLPVDPGAGRSPAPSPSTVLGATGRGAPEVYADAATSGAMMTVSSVGASGGSQPHNNMMPYLTLNYCISLQGVFPVRP
jgi:microcystin-dependent protein